MKDIDIWSKGEVSSYLLNLTEIGQIKPCIHLCLELGYTHAYYPKCKKDWASRVNANNVSLDITAYSAPSSYWWPKCPNDCPHFTPSDNFLLTVSEDQLVRDIADTNENMKESLNGSEQKEDLLKLPEKVTLVWLITNVDWKFWVTAISILGTTFYLGIQASNISLAKEIFGLQQEQVYQNHEPKNESSTKANYSESKLNSLQSVISSLNNTTLVNRYNSNEGWSGFESLPGKGEHSLQCAVDRFFLTWNENVQKMKDSGCTGISNKVTGVHHPGDCN
jgi:hypothetical protein